MKMMIVAVTLLMSSIAGAAYSLAGNGQKVQCFADDNQSWDLNKARTKIQYTIEGESLGAQKITHQETDGQTFISYQTSEGVLTLSDRGDTYQFAEEDEAVQIRCR